jgi:hypothetical protein
MVNAAHVTAAKFGDLLSTTPLLAALEVDVIIGRHHRPEPESANNNPLKRNGDGAAGDITIVRPAAAAPPRRPEQVEMRRAGFSATTRQGIKNTISPAGNVGERARRSHMTLLNLPVIVTSTPYLRGRFEIGCQACSSASKPLAFPPAQCCSIGLLSDDPVGRAAGPEQPELHRRPEQPIR